jgi:hypothetical protein
MKALFIVILFAFTSAVWAQSKKDLKDAGVVSRTENTSKLEKKSMVNYIESTEKYDANGNKIEVIEYKSDGDIKNYDRFEYNDKGKLVKEIHIDPLSKKPKETIEYTYGEDDKLMKEIYYNKKNEVYKTVEYTYDNKLKTEKKITNNSGKVIETKTYIYEKK